MPYVDCIQALTSSSSYAVKPPKNISHLHLLIPPTQNLKSFPRIAVMELNTSQTPTRYAVVTGANKGIGLETVRRLANTGATVVLTARNEKRGLEATKSLHESGLSNVVFHQLDVRDAQSIQSLAQFVTQQFERLDILVNNAGASGVKVDEDGLRALNIDPSTWRVPNEQRRKELGDIDTLTEEKIDIILKKFLHDLQQDALEANGWQKMLPAYSISKATLNAYTRILAKRYPKMCINCVHPGYVNTDINWHTGTMTVQEGAEGPVMLALLPEGGPTGCYFDRTRLGQF
ncbi:(+)-neomenthol dehydrogenase [Phtheirospermum japonicum]|uniref:(+)-neomenthol dehydrogenase n=1 Tax=Phtheirospermum japonicum TaxID=374723 RepID=A0A830BXF9_9LAMI|nr:(+)-neomenthol dehydrogenase [Phtheirospermum japonicum]